MRLILPMLALLTLAGTVPAADAFDVLNTYRADNRLPPFKRDEGLSRAAEACATHRARLRLFGHTASDFAFLPAGTAADAAGCAAYPAAYGIMACGLRDDHTHAGAAVVVGGDGRCYWHVFYRGGSGRELIPPGAARPGRPYTPAAVALKPAPKAPPAPKDCTCGDGCKCQLGNCPDKCPVSYADGFRRVAAGETLKLAVNQPAKAGQVQAPPMPGKKPGVYRWYSRGGVPTVDVVTVAGAGPGTLGPDPLTIPLRPVNPFAVPGCPTCQPGRR